MAPSYEWRRDALGVRRLKPGWSRGRCYPAASHGCTIRLVPDDLPRSSGSHAAPR